MMCPSLSKMTPEPKASPLSVTTPMETTALDTAAETASQSGAWPALLTVLVVLPVAMAVGAVVERDETSPPRASMYLTAVTAPPAPSREATSTEATRANQPGPRRRLLVPLSAPVAFAAA